jgi:SPASM domain peptide maturase of grasp-with-spasm system
MKPYFNLFSFAVPVMGKEEAIIVNLYDSGITKIPLFLCELLQDFSDLNIAEQEKMYNDHTGNIRKYFDYLVSNDLGRYTDRSDEFPKIDLTWESHSELSSAAIEVNTLEGNRLEEVLHSLEELECRFLEIWFKGNSRSFSKLISLLEKNNDAPFRSVDLLTPYDAVDASALASYKERVHKLTDFIIYNAPSNKKDNARRIYLSKRNPLKNGRWYKELERDEYIIVQDFFCESQQHNPYYNRKVCIDADGNIKNCFSHQQSFGNTRNGELMNAVRSNEFRELWFACNDKVLEVKDSPYRYIWLNMHELEKTNDGYYRIMKKDV